MAKSAQTQVDAKLVRGAEALDAAYAGAAEFDAKALDAWVHGKFEQFTKRTEYPKLGYLIHLLNEAGIASIVHGCSFHGPLLYVEKGRIDDAWALLTLELDEVPDDDPQFAPYADTQPDTDLYD